MIFPKTVNRAHIAGGQKILTQFAQQFVTVVTSPPRVGCVIWNPDEIGRMLHHLRDQYLSLVILVTFVYPLVL